MLRLTLFNVQLLLSFLTAQSRLRWGGGGSEKERERESIIMDITNVVINNPVIFC